MRIFSGRHETFQCRILNLPLHMLNFMRLYLMKTMHQMSAAAFQTYRGRHVWRNVLLFIRQKGSERRNKKVWPLERSISVADWFPEAPHKDNCKAIKKKRPPHLWVLTSLQSSSWGLSSAAAHAQPGTDESRDQTDVCSQVCLCGRCFQNKSRGSQWTFVCLTFKAKWSIIKMTFVHFYCDGWDRKWGEREVDMQQRSQAELCAFFQTKQSKEIIKIKTHCSNPTGSAHQTRTAPSYQTLETALVPPLHLLQQRSKVSAGAAKHSNHTEGRGGPASTQDEYRHYKERCSWMQTASGLDRQTETRRSD